MTKKLAKHFTPGGIATCVPYIVIGITGGVMDLDSLSPNTSRIGKFILTILAVLTQLLMVVYGIFQFLWVAIVGVTTHTNFCDDYPIEEPNNPYANGTADCVWLQLYGIGGSVASALAMFAVFMLVYKCVAREKEILTR